MTTQFTKENTAEGREGRGGGWRKREREEGERKEKKEGRKYDERKGKEGGERKKRERGEGGRRRKRKLAYIVIEYRQTRGHRHDTQETSGRGKL